jgi:gamma-glutamylcysteine synthetase
MRNGKYINFEPVPVNEYFKMDSLRGEYFDGKEYCDIEFEPCMEDLEHLRTFKFEDLTYRGTIEFRSTCTQPASDSMSAAAFHIGLMNNLQELEEWLDSDAVLYSHGYDAVQLQRMLERADFPEFVNRERLKAALREILDISRDGLRKRGKNEEAFLAPLYERAKTLKSPSRVMLDGIEKGEKIEAYIEKFSLF